MTPGESIHIEDASSRHDTATIEHTTDVQLVVSYHQSMACMGKASPGRVISSEVSISVGPVLFVGSTLPTIEQTEDA